MVDEAAMMQKSEQERAQLLLDLIDKVDSALDDVSHSLKVLVTLRVAASWAIANGVSAEQFGDAAIHVFKDTLTDIKDYAQKLEVGERRDCETCGNSGFVGPHDYGGVCPECGGQSVHAKEAP
jgi:hypothetical protein